MSKSKPKFTKSPKGAPKSGVVLTSKSTSIPSPENNVDKIHTNDISWWNRAPILFNDATRIPFNRIVGDPIKNSLAPITTVTTTVLEYAEPGIMRIAYEPGIGYATSSDDPVNRAFTSIYVDMYSRTTGTPPFQQADTGLLVLGISSIVQMIGLVKRALGISMLYPCENYYYPAHLMRACGFDPASVLGKQDNIRVRLNQQIMSINGMKLPNFIDLFKRQYTLTSNIFADEDSTIAQLYAFVPDSYFLYDDANSRLTAVDTALSTSGGDMSTFLDKIDAAIAAWRNSSDLGIIGGAIMRAYKDSALLTIDPVTVDSVVVPVYDKVMLYQINNAIALGNSIENLNVVQDVPNNLIKYQPSMLAVAHTAPDKAIIGRTALMLNSFDGSDDPDFVMEATRLMAMVTVDAGGSAMQLVGCGTEICTQFTIYSTTRVNASSVPILDKVSFSTYQTGIATSNLTYQSFARITSLLSRFRCGPRVVLGVYTGTGPYTLTDLLTYGDLYRYTTLSFDDYRLLNTAALQSLYLVNDVSNMKI